MGVHDQHMVQLHKLNFVNYLDLTQEIKTSESTFESYNPNWAYLRVLKYVEGEPFDYRVIDKMQWQVLRVDKKVETVAQLEERISGIFDIPVDKLVILLRHEHIYNNTVRSELYNMDWRKPKTIEEASRLDHGQVLFVEEGEPKGKLETFKWHQEFTKDQDRLSLLLNDPNTDPEATVFSIKIEVRKDNTLSELKQIVSEHVKLQPSEFVLKRYMVQREYKQMSAKLSELGLSNGNLIKVEKGKPHQDGVYEVNIKQVAIIGHSTLVPMPDSVSEFDAPDSYLFNSTNLFKIKIAPDASALEFK